MINIRELARRFDVDEKTMRKVVKKDLGLKSSCSQGTAADPCAEGGEEGQGRGHPQPVEE